MTENPKSDTHFRDYMRLKSQWIIYLVAIICCLLAFVGGLSYPLVNQGLLNIIAYEAAVILVTFGLLLLIHKKGLPDT
ncbi:MAG: hypothetical protein ACFFEU_00090 [Candidatus Thorarchaeota archaeon]